MSVTVQNSKASTDLSNTAFTMPDGTVYVADENGVIVVSTPDHLEILIDAGYAVVGGAAPGTLNTSDASDLAHTVLAAFTFSSATIGARIFDFVKTTSDSLYISLRYNITAVGTVEETLALNGLDFDAQGTIPPTTISAMNVGVLDTGTRGVVPTITELIASNAIFGTLVNGHVYSVTVQITMTLQEGE